MKKVLFGLFALSTVALASETNVYLRAGADLFGDFTVIEDEDGKYNKDDNDGFAYEIAVEATREIYPNLEVGVGLAYQNHNSPKSTVIEDMKSEFPETTSIPLYLTSKYNFEAVNGFVPYVKADLGYSFNDCDDWKVTFDDGESVDVPTEIKDGIYFGIGAGFEYNDFTMDLMYKINKGEAEASFYDGTKEKEDYDYSRVTLSFGYKFNF